MKINKSTGLLEGANYIPSPNYNERPAGTEIDLIVIHNISLPPGEFGGPYIVDLFTNHLDPNLHPYFAEIADRKVSAHCLIQRDGSVIQFVPFQERAWHAGESQYDGRPNCNDYSIGIEVEGTDEIPYTDLQYNRLVELILLLKLTYKSISLDRIVGHSNVAPHRKTDPGPIFDWVRLAKMLESSSELGGEKPTTLV